MSIPPSDPAGSGSLGANSRGSGFTSGPREGKVALVQASQAQTSGAPIETSASPLVRLRPPDVAAARELGRACGVGPTVAQVMLHRGVRDVEIAREYLDPRLDGLTSPAAMADREAAADRLASAVRRRERVALFGDYDVDGTTSAAILGGILEALGAEVGYVVANRFEGGYGLSDAALSRVRETGATLLVTCDCGSSDHPRIAAAKAAGLDVIVVDHHLVPAEPLPALAFLNPHRPDCGFPYKGLCSAGLALSVGAAVRAAVSAKLDLRPWLDLVALGTIADVAPLDGDNRRLVRAGLARIASQHARPGVVALREAARIRLGAPVGGVDVSFRLAPRLNAAGRLGDPELTLRLLRAQSLPEARMLAARIEQINTERRTIERRITEEAIAQVEEIYGSQVEGGIVAASEGWHRGVVGIVAARLVDRFGAPAVVIALEDGVGHGSARTPEGFSIHAALVRSRRELSKFGGHAAAAGVTLPSARLESFRADFDAACRAMRAELPPLDATPRVDVALGRDFPLPGAAELAMLEPVGESNEAPLFLLPDVEIDDVGTVGEGHLKLALRVGGRVLSGFGWEMAHLAEGLGPSATLWGSLRPDSWRGGDAVELRIDGVL
ncbi:MAG: single-stranded-DNA-specific exonuclease RecJ [Sandaracinaceae bacterium]|nr:single-stranded-DNA-specific exonuclease RecJ [Sandaracinaceae bacterium]